ncbi:M15 family metallopeptidase [Actinomarinicola tropica]|uniref:M15 family metallopeptidase n=1 Tax=Actinomarinicola tropica TaxID=2789776 RepID=UPI001E5F69DE|nr:M15 family metallopeptidase [Actinomarinicola tropica]
MNPFQNPYVRGDVVLPERASAYLDRDWHRPGMIQPGDVVTRSFAAIGWTWAGEWSSPDLMHFTATGR